MQSPRLPPSRMQASISGTQDGVPGTYAPGAASGDLGVVNQGR